MSPHRLVGVLLLGLAVLSPPVFAAPEATEKVRVGPASLEVPSGLTRRSTPLGEGGDMLTLSAGDEVVVITVYRGRSDARAPTAEAARRAHVEVLVKATGAQAVPLAVRPLKLLGRVRSTTAITLAGRAGFVAAAEERGHTVVVTALLREGSAMSGTFDAALAALRLSGAP
jgi:hypothetical protein